MKNGGTNYIITGCPEKKSQKSQQSIRGFKSRASMAESSSSNNNGSSSPITHIAQEDQLFTILLLLPIHSILSFAMTCRRFRSLITYSDTLWESICRRDLGHPSVDSLKSDNQLLPWKLIYQHLYQLDSVSCHSLVPHGDDVYPGPRASHSLNFVSGFLVLFGGGCAGGRHLDDTWIAYAGGNDVRKVLKWQRINSGVPSGRFGHSCVVIGDSLVLFGGINDLGVRQNDTWVGQIKVQESLGVTLSWRLLDVGSIAPPPRGAHAGCCIDDKRMLIHGGIGLSWLRVGDTWILDLSENLCFGTWHEIVTHPSPPACSGHSLNRIGGTQTVLFGGRSLGFEVLSDVWLFDTSDEGHLRWVQLINEPRNSPDVLSLARVGHSATLILGGRLLIYGGEDSYRKKKDDFWVLDINPKVQQTTVRPTGFLGNIMWKRVESNGGYKPNSRSFHGACADQSGRYLYVFGGMVDDRLIREAPGVGFDGELFRVDLIP